MKGKILFFVSIAFIVSGISAQNNLTPISIDCWSLNQNSFTNLNPHVFNHYSCFEAPGNGNVVITGDQIVDLTAGKQIHLQPGFSVSGLTGAGNFHAGIEAEEVGVAVFTPASTFGQVSKCEKLELGFRLPQNVNEQITNYFNSTGINRINPFDPEQISIEAVFTHYPNDIWAYYETNLLPQFIRDLATIRKSFGFYYEEYHVETNAGNPHGNWIRDTTSFNFRLRFAPNKVGYWRGEIVVKINNQSVYSLKPIYFECTPSDCPGFLTGGETTLDERHFEFENGDAFFGIGQNIVWPDLQPPIMPPGYGVTRAQPPKGYEDQRNYILDLANNGGNLVRIIPAEWTDVIEWEKLGDYKQAMSFAWEFDRTVDLMTEKEVYFLWCMQLHSAFLYHNPWGDDRVAWPQNPYNIELGLPNPEAFFSNADALKYFKRKIRYMMSRWGYSPQLAAIQPYSEINDAATNFDPNSVVLPLPEWFPLDQVTTSYHPYVQDPSFRNTVNEWFHEIKIFIQDDLGYNFNIGSSFTSGLDGISDNNPILADADFNDFHPYGNNRNRNIGSRWGGLNDPNGYGLIIKNNKPAIIAENGSSTPDLYECGEHDWHIDLWATSMMGGWGAGLNWWIWKGEHNTRFNYNYMKTFFSNIDFRNYKWIPQRWPESDINNPNYDAEEDDYFEALYMVGDLDAQNYKRAFGWVHNRSSYWYNKRGACEDSIIQSHNTDSNPDNNIGLPCIGQPGCDDDNYTTEQLQTDEENRIIKLSNMSNLQQFDIDWFDPANGSHLTTTDDTDFGLGYLHIQVPAEINSTQYRDLIFMLRPKGSSFMNPFFTYNESTNNGNLNSKENNSITAGAHEANINEGENSENMTVFPNPSKGIFTVNTIDNINIIEVYDVMGKLVHSHIANSNESKIDLSKQSQGIYFIKASTENFVYTGKILIQNNSFLLFMLAISMLFSGNIQAQDVKKKKFGLGYNMILNSKPIYVSNDDFMNGTFYYNLLLFKEKELRHSGSFDYGISYYYFYYNKGTNQIAYDCDNNIYVNQHAQTLQKINSFHLNLGYKFYPRQSKNWSIKIFAESGKTIAHTIVKYSPVIACYSFNEDHIEKYFSCNGGINSQNRIIGNENHSLWLNYGLMYQFVLNESSQILAVAGLVFNFQVTKKIDGEE